MKSIFRRHSGDSRTPENPGRSWAPACAGATKNRKGQVLVVVLMVLTVLSILVPVMVMFVQQEAKWSTRQTNTTVAFHQAEAGTEKALLAMTISTATWVSIQKCTFGGGNPCSPSGFSFDQVYSDIGGGSYAVYITSGPSSEQATIYSVGRDFKKGEVRSLKVIYSNAPLGNVAIYAGNGILVSGGVTVEWGAIITPVSIDFGTTMPTYPQAYSAGAIAPAASALPPRCDSPNCVQWHSYYPNIPPSPAIDLTTYKSSAQATSTYYSGNQTWENATANPANQYVNPYNTVPYTSTAGYTTYIDGNLYVNSSDKMTNYKGTLIVMGTFSTANGSWGDGCATMVLPQKAWMQYGNNWAHYDFNDATKPASFPGVNSSYLSPSGTTYTNCPPNKTALSGFMYVQGDFVTGGGGGSTDVYGSLYVVGTSSATSNSGVTVYYNDGAVNDLQTTQVLLSRTWWQDVVMQWPSGLP